MASKKNAVRERPILFSGPMVRAILDGRKTQTRRVVKAAWQSLPLDNPDYRRDAIAKCPYGQPGDRLWVRETWQRHPAPREHVACYAATGCSPECVSPGHLWRPSIFMPRALCRLVLEITEVRVERLQSISRADVDDEGLTPGWDWQGAYRSLWDSLNAKRGYGWDANPWVWVISFKPVESRPSLKEGSEE